MRRTSAAAIAYGAAIACSAPNAVAQEDALTRSNALFDEAKGLLGEGQVAVACERFAESYRLAPRGGTLLNLGLCHEREGKWLAARRELRDALAVAKRDGRADREPIASEHLAAVEARLSWIAVAPPPNAEAKDVEVRVDGAAVDPSDWPAIAVEAGEHVVGASAPGFRRRQVAIRVGEGAKASVQLAPLDAEGPQAGGEAPAPPSRDVPRAATLASSGWKTAALATGIVGMAISLGTGAWALERRGVVRNHCDAQKQCDGTGESAASTGRALVVVSTAAFGVGAVGFGAWLLLPSPMSNASGAGVTFRRAF
jgi:hypothetical protein